MSSAHIARFNAIFRKSVKWGIIDSACDAESLISDARLQLFKRFKDNTEHCLNQLLPKMRDSKYDFRKRGHEFLLPVASKALFKKEFCLRLLI